MKEVDAEKLVDLDWKCQLLGVSLQVTLYNRPRALSELINFLDKSYYDQYNIHCVTPRPEHRISQVLIHLILRKEHSLSQLLRDVESLEQLVQCRVKDNHLLTEDKIDNFFRIA